jgi:transcriptional regulator of met regulon
LRSVTTNLKTRVKNLKTMVLEDLGLKESCSVRLYSETGEPLIGDMDLVKDMGCERVQAELFYELTIQVENMGG